MMVDGRGTGAVAVLCADDWCGSAVRHTFLIDSLHSQMKMSDG